MTETVVIKRFTEGTDVFGDPVPGEWVDHLTASGKIAPNNPSEPVEVGRNAVITGGTVYIRSKNVLDIKSADRVAIRGETFEIDGEVGVWQRRHEYGHQFAFKRVGD